MMQFGSCFLLLAEPEDPLGVKAISAVKAAGYDYAEVSLARLFSLPEEAVIEYRKQFEAAGLPIRVFNNGVAAGLCMISQEGISPQVAEYMEHTIWLAKTLGVDTITMSGPNRKTTPKDIDWDRVGKRRYIEVLGCFADKCKAEGLEILIEPINEQEQSYIATLAMAESVVNGVQRDNLGIIMDYYHLVRQRDNFEDALRLCSNHIIRHVHFADPDERVYPVRENAALYAKVLKSMLKAGYNGRISVEAFAHGELIQTLQDGLDTLHEALK